MAKSLLFELHLKQLDGRSSEFGTRGLLRVDSPACGKDVNNIGLVYRCRLWLTYTAGAAARAVMAGAGKPCKPLSTWCGAAKRGP